MTIDEAVRVARGIQPWWVSQSEALETLIAGLEQAQARLVEMYERIIPEEIAKGCAAERRELERLRALMAERQAWIDSNPLQWVMRKDCP